jgi:dUTP pyrophosphatase
MENRLEVRICRLHPQKDADIPLPRYMTSGSAGMDISIAIDSPYVLAAGDIGLLPTGFAIALPPGYEAQIRPRSGLAVKHGIGLINAPGTIDSDYRGEVKIAVINFGRSSYTFQRGDRVAQMVIARAWQVRVKLVDSLAATDRSSGGFGHTGK